MALPVALLPLGDTELAAAVLRTDTTAFLAGPALVAAATVVLVYILAPTSLFVREVVFALDVERLSLTVEAEDDPDEVLPL